jgi:hypothetical protein
MHLLVKSTEGIFPDYWVLRKQANDKRTGTFTRLQLTTFRNKTMLTKWLVIVMLHRKNITIFVQTVTLKH